MFRLRSFREVAVGLGIVFLETRTPSTLYFTLLVPVIWAPPNTKLKEEQPVLGLNRRLKEILIGLPRAREVPVPRKDYAFTIADAFLVANLHIP